MSRKPARTPGASAPSSDVAAVQHGFPLKASRFLLFASLASLTGISAARAAPPAPVDTDTPIWRAEHGLLLGLAHAGNRVVAVGDAGHILLSDDQGAHWRKAKSPTDELLTAVIFPAPKEGWAVGQDETILHSTDAGETWTQVHLSPTSDQTLFSVISLGPNHIFTSGAYDLILESTDGVSFKESKIPNLDEDYHLNCATPRGDDVLLTGEAGHAFVRYAGAWTPMKLPYDGSQFACLTAPGGDFYSFGLRGSAFRAEPGSKTWTKIDTGTQASFFGATMLSNNQIALVGSNGLVMLLDPATGHVSTLPRPTEETLSGVLEIPNGHLLVVGNDGLHDVAISQTAASATGVTQ